MRTVSPGFTFAEVNSSEYAVSQLVPSAAASSMVRLAGLANTLALGTWVRSAMVPAYFSERIVRRSPGITPAPSVPTKVYGTTSVPAFSPLRTGMSSSRIPAASVPRIIGVCSAERPTPCRLHTSWWFTLAALTRMVDQNGLVSGSGMSPTSRTPSGSS